MDCSFPMSLRAPMVRSGRPSPKGGNPLPTPRAGVSAALERARQLDARSHPELRVDPRQVVLDRLAGEMERRRDLLVRAPLGHQLGDLALAGGELLARAALAPYGGGHAGAAAAQLARGL